MILEPKKIVCHCFCFFPIYLPWSDGKMSESPNPYLVLLKWCKSINTSGPSPVPGSPGQEGTCGMWTGSPSGQSSSVSVPVAFSRSLGEARRTGWAVRLGYLWNSISPAPCHSQELHRESTEKDFVWACEGDSIVKWTKHPPEGQMDTSEQCLGTRGGRTKRSSLGVRKSGF